MKLFLVVAILAAHCLVCSARQQQCVNSSSRILQGRAFPGFDFNDTESATNTTTPNVYGCRHLCKYDPECIALHFLESQSSRPNCFFRNITLGTPVLSKQAASLVILFGQGHPFSPVLTTAAATTVMTTMDGSTTETTTTAMTATEVATTAGTTTEVITTAGTTTEVATTAGTTTEVATTAGAATEVATTAGTTTEAATTSRTTTEVATIAVTTTAAAVTTQEVQRCLASFGSATHLNDGQTYSDGTPGQVTVTKVEITTVGIAKKWTLDIKDSQTGTFLLLNKTAENQYEVIYKQDYDLPVGKHDVEVDGTVAVQQGVYIGWSHEGAGNIRIFVTQSSDDHIKQVNLPANLQIGTPIDTSNPTWEDNRIYMIELCVN